MDDLVVVAFFLYFSFVLSNKNGAVLLTELEKDKKFFIWITAFIVLYSLKDDFGIIGKSLFLLFMISTTLNTAPELLEKLNTLLDKINDFIDNPDNDVKNIEQNQEVNDFVKQTLHIYGV